MQAQNEQSTYTANFTQQTQTGQNSNALVENSENINESALNNNQILGKPVISEKTDNSKNVITSVNSAMKNNISASQQGTTGEEKNGNEKIDGLATNAEKTTLKTAFAVEQKNGAENVNGLAINPEKATVQTAYTFEQKKGAENVNGLAINAEKNIIQTASTVEQKKGAGNPDEKAEISDKPLKQANNETSEKTGIISQILGKAEQNTGYQPANVSLKSLNSDNFSESEGSKNGNNQLPFQSDSDANFEGVLNANQLASATKHTDNVSDLKTGQDNEIYTPKDVGGQVQESIRNSIKDGVNEITIRLNPPELGKVEIKFEQQDNQITGLLEVSKAETRVEIQQALPEIIRNIQDSGIQLRRLEVVMSDSSQTEQQTNQDSGLTAGQNGSSGQNGSTGQENQDNSGFYEWLNDSNAYTSINDSKEMLVADTSINLLI